VEIEVEPFYFLYHARALGVNHELRRRRVDTDGPSGEEVTYTRSLGRATLDRSTSSASTRTTVGFPAVFPFG
jgi:hypothetical protein